MHIEKGVRKKLNVEEMRMLREMCGVTKVDIMRNERIRGRVKVMEESLKAQKRRLQ